MTKTKEFQCELDIRWGDMDALGHVNNTVYIRFMEQARIAWFEQSFGQWHTGEQGPVLVHAECQYLKPLKYPARIRVGIQNGELGRSSFWQEYRIASVDDTILYATGRCKIVWIDYRLERSIPLPDALKTVLQ